MVLHDTGSVIVSIDEYKNNDCPKLFTSIPSIYCGIIKSENFPIYFIKFPVLDISKQSSIGVFSLKKEIL